MGEEFLALVVEYQFSAGSLRQKKDYIVIAVWVLTNTSVEDIQEPAVLERTTPAV